MMMRYKSNNIMKKMVVLVVMVGTMLMGESEGRVTMNYYLFSCPMADFIVKNSVNKALQSDPTLAAGLIRMHFHDCFIQGCDGSVLIDSTKDNTAEKDSPANLSLRGYEIIDDAKQQLENVCPGVVSCADILAMAARDAVFFAGGPVYDIGKGRKDGTRSKIEDTRNLPPPIFNTTMLLNMFGPHGFTPQDLVALSGGHTLGVARCSSFKHRLKNFDSTNDVDPSIDTQFVKTLAAKCSSGDNAEQPFDMSRNTFDNAYYNAIQRNTGLLFSDQTLISDPRTRPFVNAYAMNQARFFFDFQQAMIKMGTLDIQETGQVRQNCRKIN